MDSFCQQETKKIIIKENVSIIASQRGLNKGFRETGQIMKCILKKWE